MICTAVSRSHKPIQCERHFPALTDLYSLTGGELVSQRLALADGGFRTISPLVLLTDFSGLICSVTAAGSRESAIELQGLKLRASLIKKSNGNQSPDGDENENEGPVYTIPLDE